MYWIYVKGTDWSINMNSQTRDTKVAYQNAGRPREFDENEVLDNVMLLFWQNGYEGTGLKDIETATGLAKGSIYKAFKSKHNLYLQSLKRYEAVHVDAAVDGLKSNALPYKRLENFLSAPINDVSKSGPNKGCFLCNASADRSDGDKDTRDLVRRGFKKMTTALAMLVRELKPGWDDTQSQQTAQMLMSIYSGLRIMSRAGVDTRKLEEAKTGALRLLS